MRFRTLATPFVAVALVMAVACGGDDNGGITGGSSSAAWDVNRADELAHAALLQAGELPGSGWDVTDDDFDQDDEAMQPSCSDFEAFKKDARTASVKRAKRSLEKAGATRDDFGTQVESTVNIFKDSKTAGDLVGRYKAILNSEKFVTCFQDQIKKEVGGSGTVDIKRGTAATSAPASGSSAALEVDVKAGRDQLLAHTENYVWQNGNAVIQINVTSTKTSFNADTNKQAVSKQEQAANDAVKGNRKALTAPTQQPVRNNPTPAPTARPGGSPTPQRSSSAGPVLNSLADTSSHRYTIKVESSGLDFLDMEQLVAGLQREAGGQAPRPGSPIAIDIEGAYSKPDKGRVTYSTGNARVGLTTIGTQQWKQVGTKIDGPTNVERQSPEDLSVAAASLSSITEDPDVAAQLKCDSNLTTVNGGPARRCGFTNGQLARADLQSFVDGFLEGTSPNVKINAQDVSNASFEVWSSQQGDFPVRFLFVFEGKDSKAAAFKLRLEANVTDINKTVEITAPR